MREVRPLPPPGREWLGARAAAGVGVDADVGRIVNRVRQGGDAALRDLTLELDRVEVPRPRVPLSELGLNWGRVPGEQQAALRGAAERIAAVAMGQRFSEEESAPARGLRVWREWRPLQRVGLYVPGGRAPYPSSVLMLAVPARVAGCREVALCSPPGPDGRVNSLVLAAAHVAGVTEVYAMGGAQAIAAFAYGTESVAPVEKIFGPGNRHVTSAKRLVSSHVAVDMPAGPSEVVLISDGVAPPAWLAADLDAQSEHAPDAMGVLVSTDRGQAEAVGRLVRRPDQVAIFLAPSLSAAVEFVNGFGPEHLILACRNPEDLLADVRSAGSVFLGSGAPAAAGDYATGASHVLPTGGASRSFSALGLDAFGHTLQVQAITPAGLRGLAPIAVGLATAEGFVDHARSVSIRLRPGGGEPIPVPLPRLGVRDLNPYEWEPSSAAVARRAGIPEAEVIRFDTNTSWWELVSRAEVAGLGLAEYPDSGYEELVGRLQDYVAVPGTAITVGAGADELLDLIARTFAGRNHPVVIPAPTYPMFKLVARAAGASVIEVPVDDQAELARQSAGARVTFLCNPNNPTGTAVSNQFIADLAQATPGLVVVDEAYFEFYGTSSAELVPDHPNLVAVRTLSKAFGLAGARVGYAVASPEVGSALARLRPPASVATASAALACLALERADLMRTRVGELRATRADLANRLLGLGLPVRTTDTNFLLVGSAPGRAQRLLQKGLVVRTYAPDSALGSWMRVTVRSVPENARLLEALAAERDAT